MRSVILVIDSFGFGEQYDSAEYGDKGANTALHICQNISGKKWPNLQRMGLGNAAESAGFSLPGCEAHSRPLASYGYMEETSPGKDTTTGHWEMMGIILDKPFHVFDAEYPSFPESLTEAFIDKTGCGGILGNKAASGTVIIEELGSKHLETRYPICYTSADSVFQIAAHKSVYPIEKLYDMCKIARQLCNDFQIGRVIARPFDGEAPSFFRTPERHDFSINLPAKTLLDIFGENQIETVGVGKIGSIFNEQGLARSFHDAGNPACLQRTEELLRESTAENQLIFVNLVDTDMIYGHRRDLKGYFDSVSQIDAQIGRFIDLLDDGDQLIITADHGCDPTFKGSDHTREQVPLLFYRKGIAAEHWGGQKSFTFLASKLAESYGISL